MSRFIYIAFAALAVAGTARAQPAAPRPLDAAEIERLVDERLAAQPPTAGWKDGFFLQTADGTSKLEIGGGAFAYQPGVFNGVADGASGDGDVSNGKELAARVFVQPGGGFGLGAAVTFGDKHGTLASPDLPTFRTQAQTPFFQYRADP